MNGQSFTTGLTTTKSPQEVYDAIIDVHSWWSGVVDGSTDHVGAEFTYRYRDLHESKQRVVELVPGQRVVWDVIGATLTFVPNQHEWKGTRIRFEIGATADGETELRFTHEGLVPACDCYRDCSNGWSSLMSKSLRHRIDSGKHQPDVFA